MKWVLPLIRHLVLEEHMTSPLMQSKAICNPHHCTPLFFLIFMKGIGRRGTSAVLSDEYMQLLKGKLGSTIKTLYLILNMEINPGCFCIILEKLNICLCPFFFCLFPLSFLSVVTFQRVDGGLMSNGRWVWSMLSAISQANKINLVMLYNNHH